MEREYIKKKERKSSPMKILAIVLSSLAGVLVLLAIGLAGFLWYTGSVRGNMFASRGEPVVPPVTEQRAEETVPEETEPVHADWIDEDGSRYNYRDNVITILIMGVDYMDKSYNWKPGTVSNGGNTDILGLVLLNTDTFDFSILYIPRDTIAEVTVVDKDGNYQDTLFTNICTAHSYGDGGELSNRLTEDAVSKLLCGAPINRYAALKFDAIYTLGDLVGGLDITFDQDYTDVFYSFKKDTTQTLSGWYLYQFIHYRNMNQVESATLRGERSMVVLKALFDKCKQQLKEDPMMAFRFLDALGGNFETDLDVSEIAYLARNIGKMEFTSATVIKLPGETVMGEKYAEFHHDAAWLHDFVVEKLCTPAE